MPLPLAELDGRAWNYPLGAADAREISGRKFDAKNWKRTPQFYYAVGRNNSLSWATAAFIGRPEGEASLDVLGLSLPARWNRTAALLKQSGAALQTHFYSQRAFTPAWTDAAAFFKANGGKAFSPTLPTEM